MSEPTAPSAAQDGAPGADPDQGLPPVADIFADVDPSVPVTDDVSGDEPSDAGLGC